MFRNYFLLRLMLCGISLIILTIQLKGQETNSRAFGRVLANKDETLISVTVTLIHELTQNKYFAVTGNDSYFHFFNLKPGGPYNLIFTSVGYDTLKITNLFIHLTGEHFYIDNNELVDFILQKKTVTLSELVINARTNNENKFGIETDISSSALRAMPSINRNFQDFVRLVPQSKITGDGGMSLAGQNNRFNAFFIDGANNTDMRGLAGNGMNGGLTGSPPLSIEAIEEINVLLSPYNVQYGNFTGGSINTITRSGSNENHSSAWYYFRNEDLAGRALQPVEKPGSPGEYYRPRLSEFSNHSFGAWNSGAIVKNKLFYFALFERQSDTRPQPYNFSEYRGNSKQHELDSLVDFIKSQYEYDPGSFLETKDDLDATRINVKLDWNASVKDKLTLSYRYNNAERMTAPRPSSASAIAFHNNGVIIFARTHSASLEWKRFFNNRTNNRLLLTVTNQEDERKRLGELFPQVTLFDGNGTLTFGTEVGAGGTFSGTDLALFDVVTHVRNNHVFSAGADVALTNLNQKAIPSYFGAYTFRSVNDFLIGAAPSRFGRSFYLSNDVAAKFKAFRTSFFANDEIRLQKNLKLNFGVRLDVNSVLSRPTEDQFFNDTAVHIISTYYDLEGARSGEAMKPHWNVSPRFGMNYRLNHGITLSAGAGLFVGHTNNTWILDVFNSNTGNINKVPQNFNPDPYNQPTPESLHIDPSDLRGTLSLMASHYKYPVVFRTTLTAEKKFANNWMFLAEGVYTKNLHETAFRNVNILPPVGKSSLPDSRNIYSLNSMPPKIPLKPNGTNPYGQMMLLANNHDAKGYSYSFSFVIQKQARNLQLYASYTWLRSTLLNETTGPQTPVASQWRNMETVNGRNFVTLSTSDNDLRHRVNAWVAKTFDYAKGKTATTISMIYNGQSGNPYSYVYFNSMINDNGKANENFDLIYIPTKDDLPSMNFHPIEDNSGQLLFSPEQQKEQLNAFIENDKYLKQHRGQFAERNGARLPFTHLVDLRLQQDLKFKLGQKKIIVNFIYDVFNFTNMLNKDWGQISFLGNDSYQLITFFGYANASTLTPEYQFKPIKGNPYSLQTSTVPGNSARWISQLGVKINF